MDVRLPRLGEGADSGTVASIFVKVGDQVKKDQPVIELESEKAVASIPSPAAGTINRPARQGRRLDQGRAAHFLAVGRGRRGGRFRGEEAGDRRVGGR